MKLRNKKTGEVIILIDHTFDNYTSLTEFTEDWEDAPEEPKYWWFIDCTGSIKHGDGIFTEKSYIKDIQEIGNYFETKEEAKKAVKKLQAWKRLKDMNPDIRIVSNNSTNKKFRYGLAFGFTDKEDEDLAEIDRDVKLIFGGEE